MAAVIPHLGHKKASARVHACLDCLFRIVDFEIVMRFRAELRCDGPDEGNVCQGLTSLRVRGSGRHHVSGYACHCLTENCIASD